MTTSEITALPAGPALDAAVHKHVFKRRSKPPAYSTDEAEAFALLKLPIIAGRIPDATEGFDATRPFFAGDMAWGKGLLTCQPKFTVRAPTLPIALCKAALILIFVDQGGASGGGAPTGPFVTRPGLRELEALPERSDKPRLPTPIDMPGDRRTTS